MAGVCVVSALLGDGAALGGCRSEPSVSLVWELKAAPNPRCPSSDGNCSSASLSSCGAFVSC